MAHGREGPDIVMTTRYVSNSEIRAVSEHEKNRTPDGSSAIDPLRSHFNEILHGPATQQHAVDGLYAAGVKRPAAQSESPFVQIVLSASPEFFRADEHGAGQWDQSRMQEWRDSSMKWLRDEYGDDLAHASLHLDEDTPHIHVLIVPTYAKKPRVPGRRKKSETQDEFEARKEAAQNGKTIRTVGRSSNEYWKRNYVRKIARQSYHKAMEPLGLGYGRDFVGEGDASPPRKETAQYVREQASKLKQDRADLDEERRNFRARAKSEVAKIRDAQQKIAHDKRENTEIFKELDALSKFIEKREAALNTVLKRVKNLARSIADLISLPLPRKFSEALEDLERGVKEYRSLQISDADSAPPEDPRDETGPSF